MVSKKMTNNYLQKISIKLHTPTDEINYIIYCNLAELMILGKFMNATITQYLTVLEYLIDDSIFSTTLHEIEDKYYHNRLNFEEKGMEKSIQVDYIQL